MPLRPYPRPMRANRNVSPTYVEPKCYGYSVWYHEGPTTLATVEEFFTRLDARIRIDELRRDPRVRNIQLCIVISYKGSWKLVHIPYR
jgi:hypothetical protein